jgi:hypothetical protein
VIEILHNIRSIEEKILRGSYFERTSTGRLDFHGSLITPFVDFFVRGNNWLNLDLDSPSLACSRSS